MESEADINIFGRTPSNTSNTQLSAEISPKLDLNALDYDMSGEKFLVIFNHYTYDRTKYFGYKCPAPRQGTDKDADKLKKVFGDLDFKVIMHRDLTYDEILNKATEVATQDHSKTSCLAVVILTHGDNGLLYARDRPYSLKDITYRFAHGDRGLINKPKLFFIQACRGCETDSGKLVEVDGPEDNNIVIPSHVDFFFLYSNVEDNISWRDCRGSWLMQELCKIISLHHENNDLLFLAMLTIREVAYNYSSYTPCNKATNNKKQTPQAKFTLTKRVFL